MWPFKKKTTPNKFKLKHEQYVVRNKIFEATIGTVGGQKFITTLKANLVSQFRTTADLVLGKAVHHWDLPNGWSEDLRYEEFYTQYLDFENANFDLLKDNIVLIFRPKDGDKEVTIPRENVDYISISDPVDGDEITLFRKIIVPIEE